MQDAVMYFCLWRVRACALGAGARATVLSAAVRRSAGDGSEPRFANPVRLGTEQLAPRRVSKPGPCSRDPTQMTQTFRGRAIILSGDRFAGADGSSEFTSLRRRATSMST